MEPGPHGARDSGLFLLTALAWGANYLFVRVGLLYATPLWLSALRAGLGAVGVLGYLAIIRPPVALTAAGRRYALLLGVPNTAIFIGLWFVAAARVSPGEAAVLIYTFPLQVALLAVPVLGRKLSVRSALALLAGFGGVALVSQTWTSSSTGIPILVLVELLGAAFSWAVSTVLFQRRFGPAEMPAVNAYQLGAGAAVLIGAAVLVDPTTLPRMTPVLWISVLWLGLFGTAFAYAVWFFLLGRIPAPTLAAYSFLAPLVAVALSIAFDREQLDLAQAAGVALILLGVYAVSRSPPLVRAAV